MRNNFLDKIKEFKKSNEKDISLFYCPVLQRYYIMQNEDREWSDIVMWDNHNLFEIVKKSDILLSNENKKIG